MTCQPRAHHTSSTAKAAGRAEGRKFLDQAHIAGYERGKSNKEELEESQHAPKDTDAPISPPTPDQNEQQSSSAAVIYMRRSSSSIPMSQRRVWCLMEYPRSHPLRCRVPAPASDIPAAEAELLLAAFWFRSDDVPKRAVLSKFAEHRMKEEEQEARAARELLMADDRDREYEDVSRRPHEEDMFRQSYEEEEVSNTPMCQRGIEDTGYVSGFRPGAPASPSLLRLLVEVVTCTSCWSSPWLQQDPDPGLAGRHEAGEAGGQRRGSNCKRQPRSFRRPIKAHLPFPGGAIDPLHVPLLLGSGSEAEDVQRLLHPHHQCHSKAPGRRRSGH